MAVDDSEPQFPGALLLPTSFSSVSFPSLTSWLQKHSANIQVSHLSELKYILARLMFLLASESPEVVVFTGSKALGGEIRSSKQFAVRMFVVHSMVFMSYGNFLLICKS